MKFKLLVSPLAKGAYYASVLDVARAEFAAHFPQAEVVFERIGGLDFLNTDLEESTLHSLARLSFVQGVFCDRERSGWMPVSAETGFLLPEDLVFGVKYQGKTNELVTQLAINIGLRFRPGGNPARSLLDPMAGRGTTLLWALRYGLHATGIEQRPDAIEALHRHVKKQTKLHRLKHRYAEGFAGQKSKKGIGKFVQYEIAEHTLKLLTGDSRNAPELLGGKRFDLIVSDLPYGVQFGGGSRRNPLDLVTACARGWLASLREDGALVLIFNRYQPKRDALAAVFADLEAEVESFSAPHRMSESIVRDLLVVTKSGRPIRPVTSPTG